MAPLPFERFRSVFHVTLSFLLLLFGLYKVVQNAFIYPMGAVIDWDLIAQIVYGLFYTLTGFWILMNGRVFPGFGFCYF